jgi:chloramphenicol O-acetyltransferase type A
MREIDLNTWPRRKHFEMFSAFDYPHFNLCSNLDITIFLPFAKENQISFHTAVIYLFSKAANAIPEFRFRIHGKSVVEYDVVHPSSTILTEGDLFAYCTIPFCEPYSRFAIRAAELTETRMKNPTLEDEPGQDDLLFLTTIPWVSFTSLSHPIHMHPVDSVPRISWGKYFSEGEKVKMPLSVQVHHGLMDGLHVGRYFNLVQEYLNHPEKLLQE